MEESLEIIKELVLRRAAFKDDNGISSSESTLEAENIGICQNHLNTLVYLMDLMHGPLGAELKSWPLLSSALSD